MDLEDEDDIYAPDEDAAQGQSTRSANGNAINPLVKETAGKDEDEEEGEEVEEDESDSDIDIITERKGDPKADSVQPSRTSVPKPAPSRALAAEPAPARKDSPAVKAEAPGKETPTRPRASYPPVRTSDIDVDAKPVYEPNKKPITEIDMDADFPDDDKPWRRPGTDMTDYFNYGFDEFTWASYCLKQTNMRKEITDSKKQMEEMQTFLTMPGGMPPIPGMPGPSGGAPPGMPAMGGPSDIPPEMQQMMQQMMAQGVDPTQMDPAAFMQMMQGAAGGAGGDSNQNFGGQGYGQQNQNQQQMGYGFGGGVGGGGGGRNQGGRGQGRRW